MQTVILAAGEGTRMRPLTAHRAKPMLPVGDRPLVAHTADAAAAAGASRIVFVVGYEAAAIREHFGDEYAGVPVEYAVQASQQGTADAVRAARATLDDAPFVVLNGDDIYDAASLSTLYEAVPAVGTYEVDDPRPYGVFDIDDGTVRSVVEKPSDPPSNAINVGAYAFPAEALGWLDVAKSDRGERELTDVLARVIAERDVRAVDISRWHSVGRPWELLEANEWAVASLDRRIDGTVHPDADLRGAVVVENGAEIDAGSVVEGPVLVRRGATVGPNAYVRGHSVIGPDAKVGHAVEVKSSVLLAGATVGHLSYVGDSVLGVDVNFGAGTVVANLRHDNETVRLQVKGGSTDTGRRKFGVVVGDEARTAINTSLNAGVKLGAGARTGPGQTVTRDIDGETE